jgi:hypothetical protein
LFKSCSYWHRKNILKDIKLIDYIKILIKGFNPSILEANPLLSFFDNINLSTGELKTINRNGNKVAPSRNAYYNGLEFKIYDTGTITLSGSLHKYWNSGAHNYNDFNIQSVLFVLNDLKNKFDIAPNQCILKCLEIGINITPPIPTNEILDNCFLHKTKSFEHKHNSDEGNYKQWVHSQYIIKIYNKALHYKSKGFDINTEIMRFEIKYTKMQKLNEKEIYTLQDLINYGLHNFKTEILTEWENVLYFDNTTRIDTLSKTIKKRLLEYSNPNYWTRLINNKQIENFKNHRKQLKEITTKNSNNIQSSISKTINNKIDFLNIKTTQIDTLTILSKRVVLKNICRVTGINISMQKDESILLSHTGLKYYYKSDKKIFEQIKRTYLSKKWFNSNFEIQIKEIAHNIRNKSSNTNNKQKRIYNPTQLNALNMLGI